MNNNYEKTNVKREAVSLPRRYENQSNLCCCLFNFVCLGPLVPGNYLKANFVSLCNGNAWLKPCSVNKIVFPIVSSYKPEMLCSVKELYCACYHL